MPDELKPRPCPFCGSEKLKLKDPIPEGFRYPFLVICEDCYCQGPRAWNNTDNAIRRWNALKPIQ